MITQVILRNWKGLSGTFDLSEKTILAGENGSGKSGLLEAIAVGLTGYSSLGKKPTSTLALASDKVTEITLSDGENFLSRKFETTKTSASQTITLNGTVIKEADLEAALPDSFRIPVEAIHPAEFLALSGDKRAAWLFGNLGENAEKIEPGQIPAQPKWFAQPMPADLLLEKLTDEQKACKSESEKCKANLQRLMGQAEDLPKGTQKTWEETLANVEKDIEAATNERAKNEERTALATSKNQMRIRLEDQIKNGNMKISDTERKLESLKATLPPTNTKMDISGLPGIQASLRDKERDQRVLEHKAKSAREKITLIREKGKCPTCGATAEVLESVIEELDLDATGAEMDMDTLAEEIEELRKTENAMLNEKTARDANKVRETERKVLEDALKSYRQFVAKTQADLDKINSDESAEPVSGVILDQKIAGLKASRENIKDTLKKFAGVVALKKARSDAEAERQRLDQLSDDLKESIKIVKHIRDSVLDSLTEKVRAPFQVAANLAFQTDSFFRVIGDKGKPEVDFGIVRNGREISFDTMSGGERLVILVALVAALQIAKSGAPKLALVEMAEADGKRFLAVAEACQAVGFEQAILASYNHANIKSWNVLSMVKINEIGGFIA